MAAPKDLWIRVFDVTDPQRHQKGHTIYKVTVRMFQVESPESVTELIVWKRYNDFKKLYKNLSALHKKLQRREEFPPFAKATVFGRFEEAVIEERRQRALEFLNFAGCRNYLFHSQLFQKFLEGGEKVDAPIQSQDGTEVLQPRQVAKVLRVDSISIDSDSEVSADLAPPEVAAQVTHIEAPTLKRNNFSIDSDLGGVWKYRQNVDNISLNSNEEDPRDIVQLEETEEALGSPLPETELSFFDPLSEDSTTGPPPDPAQCSNTWLLSAMTVCAELDKEEPQMDSVRRQLSQEGMDGDEGGMAVRNGSPPQIIVPSSNGESESAHSDNNGKVTVPTTLPLQSEMTSAESLGEFDPLGSIGKKPKVECGKGDLAHTLVPSLPTTPKKYVSSTSTSSTSSPSRSPLRRLSKALVNVAKNRTESPDGSLVDMGDKGNYIYQAASQISHAKECEANGNFQVAFGYYKSGVAVLLKGVQDDDNRSRREAVRRKTAQYLLKAEDLYNRHLATKGTDELRWAHNSQMSPSSPVELDPSVAFLKGPVTELENYRVLGVVDKVMLVLDRKTERTYIIKVLHKSCTVPQDSESNIVPTSCPFMVKLYKFYESESAIYLLLQYASGGKLWDYISAYLQSHLRDMEGPGALMDSHEKALRQNLLTKVEGESLLSPESESNIYSGQNLMLETPTSVKSAPIEPSVTENKKSARTMSEGGLGLDENDSLNSIDPELNAPPQCVDSYVALFQNLQEQELPDNKEKMAVRFSKNLDTNDDSTFLSVDDGEAKDSNVPGEMENPLSPRGPGFSDILQDTKPSLQFFSINSFDSDHETSLRNDSARSDKNIESIPEINETSPLTSPSKDTPKSISEITDDVFSYSGGDEDEVEVVDFKDISLHDELAAATATGGSTEGAPQKEAEMAESDELISSARELLRSVDEALEEADKEVGEIVGNAENLEGAEIASSTPIDELIGQEENYENTPNETATKGDQISTPMHVSIGTDIVNQLMDDEEEGDVLNAHNDNLDNSLARDSDSQVRPKEGAPSNQSTNVDKPENMDNDRSKDVSHTSPPKTLELNSVMNTNVPVAPVVLSCERSLEGDGSGRRRHQSSISAVFEQLDLAAAERSDQPQLPESCVKQWVAEIIVAVSKLHSKGIVCGDLHPDNILLGDRGHIQLTYFSQWSSVEQEVHGKAIDLLYAAPEVKSVFGLTAASDWWSVGALSYELLTGQSLISTHPSGINSHTQLNIPDHISTEGQDLMRELLRYNPGERLGSGVGGSEDIKSHPFFSGIPWTAMSG